MKDMKNKLDTPTNEFVYNYIQKFSYEKNANLSDSAITKLIEKFPFNNNLEEILLKVVSINVLYSTSILDNIKMAERILALDVDSKIQKGDTSIVHEIATGHKIISKKTDKELNFYSFATKYCNWHNKNEYAIYDSFVDKVLMAYKKRDPFSDFNQTDLKSFPKFKKVLLDFISYNKLDYGLKDIDKFLWLYGKEIFPPTYLNK